MEARLLPINALLGLLTAGDITPPVLAQAGFRPAGLEIPASGDAGNAVIDALLFHEASNHLVQCEAKSGANIEVRQAFAYAAMGPESLVQAAGVTLTHRTPPTLETLYICLSKHASRISLSLESAGVSAPLLAVAHRRVDLHNREHASGLLTRALGEGVDLAGPPPSIIPFDPDSPVEVAEEYVLAALVAMLTHRAPAVTMTSLTERVAPYYSIYGQKAQTGLRRLVTQVARSVADREPAWFAFERRTATRSEDRIQFRKTPEDLHHRGRTTSYQSIGKVTKGIKRPGRAEIDGQLDLLQELEVADTGLEESQEEDEQGGGS
ncbi:MULTISPECIES: hypothetical protein [unclassified Micromonospora]|uniref:hypothetical protein n=1 Tax=unclassified Micromonospora TaxID=2617518 RepID=UPI003A8581BF